ncbi:MAG TPA: 3-phosphoshikimate 1-carboxyvinyltransferase [Saprospirales bacterium]|nr:3-phosphoshikimate 1-carboxyvinyltransferase [Saprospirales bacterium]HRQ30084.1 3-phosphoshikimate 1-carboxyvinyltransferase [Saprospiraceae bacterium]
MKIIVRPSTIKGTLTANPSKSYMQRALALCGLSGQPMTINHPCTSEDSLSALHIVQNMGYITHFENDSLLLSPAPERFKSTWHAGESGLSARMFSLIAALFDCEIVLTGEGSLLSRPLNTSIEILHQMGVSVQSNNGFLPLRIKGPVNQNIFTVDAQLSSQVLSGLLIALPFCQKNSEISLTGLNSRPYIEMTLEILERSGIAIISKDLSYFSIRGKQKNNSKQYDIEGDWSGAAFALVAGAIAGQSTVDQLNTSSFQGDKNILKVLEESGAKVDTHGRRITVSKSSLVAFDYNAEDTPDLFPPLVSLAANCSGTSKIHGISRLIHKESNRFETLKKEFGLLNIRIDNEGDTMLVHGGKIGGASVFSHLDHRIAMALFVAALSAKNPVIIDGMECISKSYPGFLKDMAGLGADHSILDP